MRQGEDVPIDPERLAAFLDGQLDDEARMRLMTELAESGSAMETLADAAAVLRDLDEQNAAGPPAVRASFDAGWLHRPAERPFEPSGAVVTSGGGESSPDRPLPVSGQRLAHPTELRSRGARSGRSLSRSRRWGMLAAAACVVLATGLWVTARGPDMAEDPAALVVLATKVEGGTPGVAEPFDWPVTRGNAATMSANARAIRYGADAAELEAAATAGDTAAVRLLTGRIVALFDDVPGSAPVAAVYRDPAIGASTPAAREVRHEAWTAAQVLLSEEAWLGAWLATARRAAAAEHAAFFQSGEAERAAAALRRAADLPTTSRTLPERILGAGQDAPTAEWLRLRADIESALRALGS